MRYTILNTLLKLFFIGTTGVLLSLEAYGPVWPVSDQWHKLWCGMKDEERYTNSKAQTEKSWHRFLTDYLPKLQSRSLGYYLHSNHYETQGTCIIPAFSIFSKHLLKQMIWYNGNFHLRIKKSLWSVLHAFLLKYGLKSKNRLKFRVIRSKWDLDK